jgi:probable rRNA maturation factor
MAMAENEININIKSEFSSELDEQWLNDMVTAILKVLSLSNKVELGVVITDNETVRQLNRDYRDLDEYTDVLSFHMHNSSTEIQFVSPPDDINHLGDVIISYPQTVKQASEQGHHPNDELLILIIHGILHLFGYDHELREEEVIMQTKANEIRKKIVVIGSNS